MSDNGCVMKSSKKDKKSKKHKLDASRDNINDNTDNLDNIMKDDKSSLSILARPLADSKQTKKLYKLIKKVAKVKQLRRGVKEVIKSIKKTQTGLLVIAGNITPLDVISHIPVYAEEHNIPYIYVYNKESLGIAAATKRPTSVVLIQQPDDKSVEHYELYQEVQNIVNSVQIKYE